MARTVCLMVASFVLNMPVGYSQVCSVRVQNLPCPEFADLCSEHYGNHACTPSFLNQGTFNCEEVTEEYKSNTETHDGLRLAELDEQGFRFFTRVEEIPCMLKRPCDPKCVEIVIGGVAKWHCKTKDGVTDWDGTGGTYPIYAPNTPCVGN